MTVAIDDEDSEYGFTLRPARSRRIGSHKLADVEFADDVALITDNIEVAKLLLDRLEIAAQSVWQVMNCSKIKLMTSYILEEISLVGSTGNQLEKG